MPKVSTSLSALSAGLQILAQEVGGAVQTDLMSVAGGLVAVAAKQAASELETEVVTYSTEAVTFLTNATESAVTLVAARFAPAIDNAVEAAVAAVQPAKETPPT
jgi:hypothetical protein